MLLVNMVTGVKDYRYVYDNDQILKTPITMFNKARDSSSCTVHHPPPYSLLTSHGLPKFAPIKNPLCSPSRQRSLASISVLPFLSLAQVLLHHAASNNWNVSTIGSLKSGRYVPWAWMVSFAETRDAAVPLGIGAMHPMDSVYDVPRQCICPMKDTCRHY